MHINLKNIFKSLRIPVQNSECDKKVCFQCFQVMKQSHITEWGKCAELSEVTLDISGKVTAHKTVL